MAVKYTLSHNRGEVSFQTLKDAISAMYVIAQYDPDCGAEFYMTNEEVCWITRKVEEGNSYTNGIFSIDITQ